LIVREGQVEVLVDTMDGVFEKDTDFTGVEMVDEEAVALAVEFSIPSVDAPTSPSIIRKKSKKCGIKIMRSWRRPRRSMVWEHDIQRKENESQQ
jgi:hypothetical protein